jgi:hypothetical protein
MANYVWGCAWKWRKGVFGGDASLHSTPLNAKNPAARIHFSNESVLNLVVKKQAETPPPPGAAGTGGLLRDNYGTHLSFLNLEKTYFMGSCIFFNLGKRTVMFV